MKNPTVDHPWPWAVTYRMAGLPSVPLTLCFRTEDSANEAFKLLTDAMTKQAETANSEVFAAPATIIKTALGTTAINITLVCSIEIAHMDQVIESQVVNARLQQDIKRIVEDALGQEIGFTN